MLLAEKEKRAMMDEAAFEKATDARIIVDEALNMIRFNRIGLQYKGDASLGDDFRVILHPSCHNKLMDMIAYGDQVPEGETMCMYREGMTVIGRMMVEKITYIDFHAYSIHFKEILKMYES